MIQILAEKVDRYRQTKLTRPVTLGLCSPKFLDWAYSAYRIEIAKSNIAQNLNPFIAGMDSSPKKTLFSYIIHLSIFVVYRYIMATIRFVLSMYSPIPSKLIDSVININLTTQVRVQ